ncbi:hypothetical protein VTN77DRAFT_5830 [Rasamsonia byssochlamydoides]|uniref:uncharacterized protein n=1 Tax=Rasamsonia byssochlamydoides TaxID=89139 RepID=UPI00374498E8
MQGEGQERGAAGGGEWDGKFLGSFYIQRSGRGIRREERKGLARSRSKAQTAEDDKTGPRDQDREVRRDGGVCAFGWAALAGGLVARGATDQGEVDSTVDTAAGIRDPINPLLSLSNYDERLLRWMGRQPRMQWMHRCGRGSHHGDCFESVDDSTDARNCYQYRPENLPTYRELLGLCRERACSDFWLSARGARSWPLSASILASGIGRPSHPRNPISQDLLATGGHQTGRPEPLKRKGEERTGEGREKDGHDEDDKRGENEWVKDVATEWPPTWRRFDNTTNPRQAP